MEIYTTRPGDSISSISRSFGLSGSALSSLNGLAGSEQISAGLNLLIPGGKAARPVLTELSAAATNRTRASVLERILPALSFLYIYHCGFENGLLLPPDDGALLEQCRRYSVAPMLILCNTASSGGYDSELLHQLLMDRPGQAHFLDLLTAVLTERGYKGVCLNFQYVLPFDRQALTDFAALAADRLHLAGLLLAVALPLREAQEAESLVHCGLDYASLGRLADRVLLLSQGWGGPFSPPMALSPLDRLRSALAIATGEMSPGKLTLSLSCMGYSWRLPWKQGDESQAISSASARKLALSQAAAPRYEPKAQAAFFTYTDAVGERRIVFFEDCRSLSARCALVGEYGLAGLDLCTLDSFDPSGLELVKGLFFGEKLL